MIDPAEIRNIVRLEQEKSLEEEIESRHKEKIKKMIKEIEAYFLDLEYEEMVRTATGEKEDLRAAEMERQIALAHGIVVTQKTSPHLYELVEQSLVNLGISEVKDLTIIIQRFIDTGGEDLFNAFCATTRGGTVFISFTPMLLNMLDDREVMDVIGHEIAHAIVPLPHYLEDYFYFVWGNWMEGIRSLDPDIPEEDFQQMNEDIQDIIDMYFDIETDAKIVRLIRLKELTADRFGLVASRSYRDSCSSLMKQQTLGITERFFDYDPTHLINQLDELASIHKDPTMRWIFDATHPVLPARIASLDAFYRSSLFKEVIGEGGDENCDYSDENNIISREELVKKIDEILQKSELLPQGNDLAELKLVVCLFYQIIKSTAIPPKSRSKIVRRMVWEKYRDLYAFIPKEVFENKPSDFRSSLAKYGKKVLEMDESHRRALMRSIIGYLKEKRLLKHDTKNYIIQMGLSLGLKKPIIKNFLKRVGAWGRYIRKR